MEIQWAGLNELRVALEQRANTAAVKDVVKHHGSSLERRMKNNAVFVKGYSHGDTRESIHLTISDGGLTATVEPGTYYSPYLEYGTRFMSAQPFVGPSFNAEKSLFISDLQKLVR